MGGSRSLSARSRSLSARPRSLSARSLVSQRSLVYGRVLWPQGLMRVIKLAGVVISVWDARVYDSREVKVIKCKVKIIKCNVSVIEGRSLRSGQVIECMLLLLLLLLLLHESHDFTRSRTKALSVCLCLYVFWSLKANVGQGAAGMGLTPLNTYCVPLPICKFRHHNFKHISLF